MEMNHPAAQLNGKIGKYQMVLEEVRPGEKDIATFQVKCGGESRPLDVRASRDEFAQPEFQHRVKEVVELWLDNKVVCGFCQAGLIDEFNFLPKFVSGHCAKCNQRFTVSMGRAKPR